MLEVVSVIRDDDTDIVIHATQMRRIYELLLREMNQWLRSGPADSFPVRLDPELRRAVDERAAAEHMTGSDVVREALCRYLRAG